MQNAVDQRQTERDQRVDRACHQSIEDSRNDDDGRQHWRTTPDAGAVRRRSCQVGGIGNTAFADANCAGRMTWISLLSTWVFTGAAPWFWPLTNLVGPYGMTWPAKVELSSALMILARSALAARSSASASSSTHE